MTLSETSSSTVEYIRENDPQPIFIEEESINVPSTEEQKESCPPLSEDELTQRKKAFYVVYFAQLLDSIGFGLLLPLLIYYFDDLPGYQEEYKGLLYGIVFSSFSLGKIIGSPIFGILSDKYGRRPALLIGLMGNSLALLGTSFAWRLELLMVARGLNGFFCATEAICSSYISDQTRDFERAEYLSWVGALHGIGLVIGPSLGGIIGGIFGVDDGFFYSCLFGAIMGMANFTFALFYLKESLNLHKKKFDQNQIQNEEKEKLLLSENVENSNYQSDESSDAHEKEEKEDFWKNVRKVSSNRNVLSLYLVTFLFSCGFSTFESISGIWVAEEFDVSSLIFGILFGLYGVIMAIFQILTFPRLVQRIKIAHILRINLFSFGIVLFFVPFSIELWQALGSILLLATFHGLIEASLPFYASLVSEGFHGSIFGIMNSCSAFANVVGPLGSGALYDIDWWIFKEVDHSLCFWTSFLFFILATLSTFMINVSQLDRILVSHVSEKNSSFIPDSNEVINDSDSNP